MAAAKSRLLASMTDSSCSRRSRAERRNQSFLTPVEIVGKFTKRLFDLINLIDKRLDAAQLALIFRADDGLENPIEHESDSKINNSRRD